MPRRGAFALLLTTAALVLLLSFRTPTDPASAVRGDPAGGTAPASTPAAVAPPTEETPAPAATGAAAPAGETAPAATPTPAPDAGTAFRDGTVTGAAVGIRWGAVQVQVTIAGGAITDVTAVQLPDGDRHSAQLSQRAEPRLRSSALATQGVEVDVVSGATYTSLAYAQSLQAALDAARA